MLFAIIPLIIFAILEKELAATIVNQTAVLSDIVLQLVVVVIAFV